MQVERVVVVGAGVMGRGIAHAASLGSFNVRLQDVSTEASHLARRNAPSLKSRTCSRGRVAP